MHQKFAYSAFGWLAFSGVLHFFADVVSQYISGKRPAGLETTYYYGLHTAYALGQVLFGVLGIIVVRQASSLLRQWPMRVLCFSSFAGWAVICVQFIEYWQPMMNIGIYGVLLVLGFSLQARESRNLPG
jgi:hypothetical protein